MGEKMRQLLESPEDIDHILDEGAARAHAIAAPIIDSVNDIVGFLVKNSHLPLKFLWFVALYEPQLRHYETAASAHGRKMSLKL